MRSRAFLKFGVVLGATLFALVLAELIVRFATVYPNTLASNRVFDENVGFRASQNVPEIDSHGYRNPDGAGREIIAIGDSQTFGLNVSSQESWPARLGKMLGKNVYNLGMGGYGLLAYDAVLKLDRDPSTKTAIVALYPVNDFELFYASDADCLILDKPSQFWRDERSRLGLEWPAYPVGCLHDDFDERSGLYDRLKQRSALLALVHDVALKIAELFWHDERSKFPSWSVPGELLAFPDGVGTLSLNRVENHIRSVDLRVPEVAAMWKNLPRFLNSWHELSKDGLKVGIVVIPSRERVILEYFSRKNRLAELDPRFVAGVQKQVLLEADIRQALEHSGLPFAFALEDTHVALAYGLQKGIPAYPNRDDGHPTSLGYSAYAAAAKRLMAKMGVQ